MEGGPRGGGGVREGTMMGRGGKEGGGRGGGAPSGHKATYGRLKVPSMVYVETCLK